MRQRAIGNSSKLYTTPVVACTIKSARPGVSRRRAWIGIPGLDNMDLTFPTVDAYGIPFVGVATAPNADDFQPAASTGNTQAGGAYIADVWIVCPAGLNTIQLGSRGFGNTATGLYAGPAYRYMKRYQWNTAWPVTVNLSNCPLLCNQRVLCCRLYASDSYFNGGYALQWNIGAGFVDVPVANCHASQPYQSSWPG